MVLLIVHFLNMHVIMRLKFWAKVHLQGVHLANHYLICFQTNCSVRDQLLSFYVKNVFSRLEVGSDKLYFISAFQVLQANMDACVSIFLRAKLTLSIWKARERFHSFFQQMERQRVIQSHDVSHSTGDPTSRGLLHQAQGSLTLFIPSQRNLVGSVQGGGDPMEPSHFPTDDVTLCCPLITKAQRNRVVTGKNVSAQVSVMWQW